MMQLMQVSYGLATAAQVAFFAYIYRLVPQDDYQRVVSRRNTARNRVGRVLLTGCHSRACRRASRGRPRWLAPASRGS
jgi:hypothetical protein